MSGYDQALSAEEWKQRGFADDGLPGPPDTQIDSQGDVRTEGFIGSAHRPHRRRHALSVLCLHEQPFGFTREDVALLRAAQRTSEIQDFGGLADNLADRIEALLPPEKGETRA